MMTVTKGDMPMKGMPKKMSGMPMKNKNGKKAMPAKSKGCK
jgi:hypothetical protein